jgi:sulfate adenylyltransferase subunit 1
MTVMIETTGVASGRQRGADGAQEPERTQVREDSAHRPTLDHDRAVAGALKFITCGSVDDGKSTLIGRLLVDSKAVLQDHLAGVQRQGETDLALLTDGLSAEREQGITIDVAYRYFSTESRKFIIGDAPGHEQYTRNMVTAASSADAAVVLVDATKLDWQNPALDLLAQTRRHSLLVNLLRVPSIIFAVNKLDAVADSSLAFQNISAALQVFAATANIAITAIVPVSALKGWNVVDRCGEGLAALQKGWCEYQGPSLLQILEQLASTQSEAALAFSFPVQWVEKFSSSSDTSKGRRIFWGRVATGGVQAGQEISVLPSGQTARVAQVLNHVRVPGEVLAGHSAGIVLDREVDVSRGDWLLPREPESTLTISRELTATVAWMDDEPLLEGRLYWALHGHRWVKAKVKRIVHKLDVNSLAQQRATQLDPNAIGLVELSLQEALATLPYAQSRVLGSLVLVDTATHKTAGAALLN